MGECRSAKVVFGSLASAQIQLCRERRTDDVCERNRRVTVDMVQ